MFVNEILKEDLIKSKNIDEVNKVFKNILDGKSIDKNLKKLEKLLNKEFNIETHIEMSHPDKESQGVYGAKVFPSKEELHGIAYKIEQKDGKYKFSRFKDVIIILDRKIFGNRQERFIDTTPEELTAVLLHEIGHKVFPLEFTPLVFMKWFSSLIINIVALTAMISVIGIAIAILLFMFSANLNNDIYLEGEYNADSLSVKYGYGPDLLRLFDKLKGYYEKHPNDRKPLESKLTKNKMANMLAWLKDNLVRRQERIVEVLEEEKKNATSDAEIELIQSQIDEVKERLG
jgi:hypothetical protein